MWFLFVSACIFLPGQAPIEGQNAGECSDAADNDVDGAFDCDDPDCVNSPDCASGTVTGPSTPTDEWGIEPVPSDIGDLSLYLFEHLDDPDPEPLRLGATELRGWLAAVSWQPNTSDDAVDVPTLGGGNRWVL